MPVAIIISDYIPAIIAEETDAALLDRLNGLELPIDFNDVETARSWLNDQPPPSGWFDSIEQAKASMLAVTREKDARS